MAKRKKSPPSYRLHRQSGQAIVTLVCAVTGKRKDVLLGEHDSADSWAAYADTIAKWERDGRVLDGAMPKPKATSGASVATVMLDWWEDELTRYGVKDPEGRLPTNLYAVRSVVRLVRATAGATPASEFGPMALQRVREVMVGKGWTREGVNRSVAVIIRAFKAAVAREVISPDVVVALECGHPLGGHATVFLFGLVAGPGAERDASAVDLDVRAAAVAVHAGKSVIESWHGAGPCATVTR
ncbi:MAG: hypothetical protein WD009_14175 [Phycisphaeraceae bacterium]